jgi:hypothetical protein
MKEPGKHTMSRKWAIELATILLITGAILQACSDTKILWKLDPEYSADLTITSTNYRAVTGKESSETVDIVRIYKKIGPKHYDMYSLSDLFSQDLFFETSDPHRIRRFFQAVQAVEDSHGFDCSHITKNIVYHVVALDNELTRAGYFILERCVYKGNEHYRIRPLLREGAGSIYYCGVKDSLLHQLGMID